MQKVDSTEALAALLDAQLRRGVRTNNFLTAADYGREMKTGLWVQASGDALCMFRDRKTHYILNFYLQPGTSLNLPNLDKPIVTELPYRPKDAAAMLATAEDFCALGFREVLRRTRRTRPASPAAAVPQAAPQAWRCHAAPLCRKSAADEFLRQAFSAYTGCLPTEDILAAALDAGQILCAEDAHGICGLLHFAPGRAASEIRHLAVREDCRRRGVASALFDAYLAETGGQKSLVWATTGNIAAEHFYETHDYRPDGWNSVVLQYGGTEQ